MTPKEQSRLQVLNSLLAEQVTLDQAAELMGVSTRHARRMLAAYRECGAAGLLTLDDRVPFGRRSGRNTLLLDLHRMLL